MNVDFLVPFDSRPPFWFFLLPAVPLVLLALPWLTLGIIVAFKGDDVDKPNRPPGADPRSPKAG